MPLEHLTAIPASVVCNGTTYYGLIVEETDEHVIVEQSFSFGKEKHFLHVRNVNSVTLNVNGVVTESVYLSNIGRWQCNTRGFHAEYRTLRDVADAMKQVCPICSDIHPTSEHCE